LIITSFIRKGSKRDIIRRSVPTCVPDNVFIVSKFEETHLAAVYVTGAENCGLLRPGTEDACRKTVEHYFCYTPEAILSQKHAFIDALIDRKFALG
jgi:hypothetical protein